MYHRIADEPSDPWRLCVHPDRFAEHLSVLRAERVRLFTVRDLVQAYEDRILPPRAIAITFDDGYYDNLELGKPLLERFETPATVFVTSGHIGASQEFWWDTIERIFLQPGELPARLELRVGEETRRWELGPDASISPAAAERLRDWRPNRSPPTMRHRLHDEVWKVLFMANRDDRTRLAGELVAWAGLPRTARATHRTMNAEELRLLGSRGFIEIGAHTITHSPLAHMSYGEQVDELHHSKRNLENILGQPVVGCSYPHGRYNEETLLAVREAGYVYACSSDRGVADRNADSFRLPRLVVEDWTGPLFRAFLARSWSSS
jgi:peptidoglycan/xylan/chitin deacetylase (PgdA/CDA1 family)